MTAVTGKMFELKQLPSECRTPEQDPCRHDRGVANICSGERTRTWNKSEFRMFDKTMPPSYLCDQSTMCRMPVAVTALLFRLHCRLPLWYPPCV